MKYLDEFRADDAARRIINEIRCTASRRWTIMEVCGGQTHGLLRYGIEEELSATVELLHGPGCPVCVTPADSIDFACELATEHGVVIASFGDMLRVPGSRGSLQDSRTLGGSVQPVYSPLDAVQIAQKNPDRQVVFFAVGFETTAPATALAVLQAQQRNVANFSILVAHVRVQPAMEMIVKSPDNQVQGFLAAGHVCTIVGCSPYEPFVRQYGVPVVVTGFEPVDLLVGIRECIRQLEEKIAVVSNQYGRSVRREGNVAAQSIVDEVYEICDRSWRGLGSIEGGGLRLRDCWMSFDAERRFPRGRRLLPAVSECRSGDVLTGRIKPPQCPHFGQRCTPETPLGAPMVSSEGACAAYYRYQWNRQPQTAGANT